MFFSFWENVCSSVFAAANGPAVGHRAADAADDERRSRRAVRSPDAHVDGDGDEGDGVGAGLGDDAVGESAGAERPVGTAGAVARGPPPRRARVPPHGDGHTTVRRRRLDASDGGVETVGGNVDGQSVLIGLGPVRHRSSRLGYGAFEDAFSVGECPAFVGCNGHIARVAELSVGEEHGHESGDDDGGREQDELSPAATAGHPYHTQIVIGP